MKIEAVVVCVNYSDFLAKTLPENLEQLDRLVIVTHPSDKATQALCNKFGVDCLKTEVMHDEGDSFNKGRAINLGLSHLRHEGFLLHLDADVLLPHNFRTRLRQAKLDKGNIYGADRLNIVGWEKFHSIELAPQFQYRYLVVPNEGLSLGARLLHNEYGYCPIGFFQLWHSSMARNYPIINGSAEHSDVLFAVQWERRNRILLPEFFVYHLESEKSPMGANWKGRTTKPFAPEEKPHPHPHPHPHPPHPQPHPHPHPPKPPRPPCPPKPPCPPPPYSIPKSGA